MFQGPIRLDLCSWRMNTLRWEPKATKRGRRHYLWMPLWWFRFDIFSAVASDPCNSKTLLSHNDLTRAQTQLGETGRRLAFLAACNDGAQCVTGSGRDVLDWYL